MAGRLVRALVQNVSDLVARDNLLRYGESYSGDRKLYDVLGYDQTLEFDDFYRKYDRGGIAGALIDKPIETTWRHEPEIQDDGDQEEETDFEAAVQYLFDEFRLLHYLERVDKAAALGRYGVLFLGLQDGVEAHDLDQDPGEGPLDVLDPDEDYTEENPPPITHFGVHTEDSLADDPKLESDPTSPRHNLPVEYQIEFGGTTNATANTQNVHWKRVIHVADDLLESEWEGRPKLKRIYNRLMDWDKVVGGVAEVAWRSADRKLIFNLDPEMGDIEDEDELEEQLDEVAHGIRTYLQSRGMDVDAIEGEVQDPSGLTGVFKEEISADQDIPQRILTGSERGDLASSQDDANFLGGVGERQVHYAEPKILRATLDRLITLGVLPQPEGGSYTVEWPNLFELNELEQAQKVSRNATALKDASPMNDPGTMLDDERIFMWLDGQYDAVLEWVREQAELEDELPPDDALPPGGPPPEDAPPEDQPPPPPGDDGEEPPDEQGRAAFLEHLEAAKAAAEDD